MNISSIRISIKWIFNEFNDEDNNEYEEFLLSLNPTSIINEYDRYIQVLSINYKISILDW